MHPIEIRLECLRLAVQAQALDPLAEAERMATFLLSGEVLMPADSRSQL